MALVTNNRTITRAQYLAGVPLTSLMGDGGGTCPLAVDFIVSATGLNPSDAGITLDLYTSAPIASASGTDSNGNIGVLKSMVNSGDDIIYTGSGGAVRNFAGGFWAGVIQGTLAGPGVTNDSVVEVAITCLVDLPADFTGPATPPNAPTDVTIEEAEFNDEGEQEVEVNWTDNGGGEEGFIIQVETPDGTTVIGAVPPNVTTFPFVIPAAVPGPITIIVQSYIGPPGNISPTGTVPLTIPATIAPPIVGTGGIDFGGTGTLQVLGDPSGIYTLVKDKTHDTLYERLPGITSQNVPIPNPFIETGYIGD